MDPSVCKVGDLDDVDPKLRCEIEQFYAKYKQDEGVPTEFGGGGLDYQAQYGASDEAFGLISVKARRHAANNPLAVFRDHFARWRPAAGLALAAIALAAFAGGAALGACPLCAGADADLGAGVNAAVSLGAKYVSNSYGGSESSSETTDDSEFYEHEGVAVTASAGDDGFGVSYPAASQFVTSVGGTSLTQASNARGWTESVWSTSSTEGTGSGCSADEAKPSWQTDTGCKMRTDNDVSAVADPNTGVAVFDTFDQDGFLEVGGTSVSSPIIASVFALAGTPASGTFPSSYIYMHTSDLFDVTTGSTSTCSPSYLCTAEVGYDGPTGWGTPDGTADFVS